MVSVMVEMFREMQLRLAETIENYETPEFRALDSGIADTFDAILRHDPKDIGEAHTVLRFLLDMIESNDAGDNSHLIERIRSLLPDGLAPYLPPMEIVNGAGI